MMIRIVGSGFEVFANVTRGEYDDLLAHFKDTSRKDEVVTLKNTYNNEQTFRMRDVKAIKIVVG